jgi:hypothetical protein
MQHNSTWGGLWGRCKWCGKGDKWLDDKHLGSKQHLENAKLYCVGAVAGASGAASSTDSAVAGGPSVAMPRPGPAPSTVASARSPDIKLFFPTGCSSRDVDDMDGAFLVDSFYYMKKSKKGARVDYMRQMLDELRQKTGKVFMQLMRVL